VGIGDKDVYKGVSDFRDRNSEMAPEDFKGDSYNDEMILIGSSREKYQDDKLMDDQDEGTPNTLKLIT
jgi:hypothetical protein